MLLIYSRKPNPALECKNSKRQPYRKTKVSAVADMRFRGVTSMHQVGGGALRVENWSEETGEARPERPTAGVLNLGQEAASLPPTSYGVWGAL